MQFTQEHDAIRRTMQQFIKNEINPFVDEWERDGIYPAHQVFKKMGDLGLLGLCKPVEYGGAALDYSYGMVMAEELGRDQRRRRRHVDRRADRYGDPGAGAVRL